MKLFRNFQDYAIYDLWREPSEELQAKVMDLWTRNDILPTEAAKAERVKQAVLVALNKAGEAVGVNTVYEENFPPGLPPEKRVHAYMYRMFIRPSDRIPHLMRIMTNGAFDVLAETRQADGPMTFLIVAENPGLNGPGMRQLLERHGYKAWMKTRAGRLVFRRDFPAA